MLHRGVGYILQLPKLYEMKYFCERLEESHSLTDSTYIVPGKPRFGSVNALDVGRVYKMENTKK